MQRHSPVVVNSLMFRTLARPRRCKFKYFLCWIHCMNKMHEQKPFTAFLHVPGEWFCFQTFLYRCLATSHVIHVQRKTIWKIPQSRRKCVTSLLSCFMFFPQQPLLWLNSDKALISPVIKLRYYLCSTRDASPPASAQEPLQVISRWPNWLLQSRRTWHP